MKRIFVTTLIAINLSASLISMEGQIPKNKYHEEDVYLAEIMHGFPNDLRFHIKQISELIRNNNILFPDYGISEYIENTVLASEDFVPFKEDLYKIAKTIIIETFAHNEKDLTQEELDFQLSKLLSDSYDSEIARLSFKKERSRETKAARLIIAGANPNIDVLIDNSKSPLITSIAATGKFASLIPLLISHGANINATTRSGNSAIMCAVAKNNIAAAELLLIYNVDYHEVEASLAFAKRMNMIKPIYTEIIQLLQEYRDKMYNDKQKNSGFNLLQSTLYDVCSLF